MDEVNKISHKTFSQEKDLIGYVYEYFLKEFAVNATKEEVTSKNLKVTSFTFMCYFSSFGGVYGLPSLL
ncbi:hypothetical protein [Gardnerella vaginalis]|uniref:hypothetical protein n=1 Tax=Gardnerella vaginalis TaxID=2702 RepID=UPI0039F10FA6